MSIYHVDFSAEKFKELLDHILFAYFRLRSQSRFSHFNNYTSTYVSNITKRILDNDGLSAEHKYAYILLVLKKVAEEDKRDKHARGIFRAQTVNLNVIKETTKMCHGNDSKECANLKKTLIEQAEKEATQALVSLLQKTPLFSRCMQKYGLVSLLSDSSKPAIRAKL